MAIPSTTGSEVMRRGGIQAQSSTSTAFRFDGTNPTTGTSSYAVPANHIIIMLSIIICEAAGNAETFKLFNNTVTMIESQAIGANQTFVYNDQFVMLGGQNLFALCSAGDCDIWYTYIDQNWS